MKNSFLLSIIVLALPSYLVGEGSLYGTFFKALYVGATLGAASTLVPVGLRALSDKEKEETKEKTLHDVRLQKIIHSHGFVRDGLKHNMDDENQQNLKNLDTAYVKGECSVDEKEAKYSVIEEESTTSKISTKETLASTANRQAVQQAIDKQASRGSQDWFFWAGIVGTFVYRWEEGEGILPVYTKDFTKENITRWCGLAPMSST